MSFLPRTFPGFEPLPSMRERRLLFDASTAPKPEEFKNLSELAKRQNKDQEAVEKKDPKVKLDRLQKFLDEAERKGSLVGWNRLSADERQFATEVLVQKFTKELILNEAVIREVQDYLVSIKKAQKINVGGEIDVDEKGIEMFALPGESTEPSPFAKTIRFDAKGLQVRIAGLPGPVRLDDLPGIAAKLSTPDVIRIRNTLMAADRDLPDQSARKKVRLACEPLSAIIRSETGWSARGQMNGRTMWRSGELGSGKRQDALRKFAVNDAMSTLVRSPDLEATGTKMEKDDQGNLKIVNDPVAQERIRAEEEAKRVPTGPYASTRGLKPQEMYDREVTGAGWGKIADARNATPHSVYYEDAALDDGRSVTRERERAGAISRGEKQPDSKKMDAKPIFGSNPGSELLKRSKEQNTKHDGESESGYREREEGFEAMANFLNKYHPFTMKDRKMQDVIIVANMKARFERLSALQLDPIKDDPRFKQALELFITAVEKWDKKSTGIATDVENLEKRIDVLLQLKQKEDEDRTIEGSLKPPYSLKFTPAILNGTSLRFVTDIVDMPEASVRFDFGTLKRDGNTVTAWKINNAWPLANPAVARDMLRDAKVVVHVERTGDEVRYVRVDFHNPGTYQLNGEWIVIGEDGKRDKEKENSKKDEQKKKDEEEKKKKDEDEKKKDEEKKKDDPPEGLSSKTFRRLVQQYFAIPENDVKNVMKTGMGTDYTVARIGIYLEPAKWLLDVAPVSDLNIWVKAARLRNTMNISLKPFDREQMDHLLSLLYLSYATCAEEIVVALQKEPRITLGFGFEKTPRTSFLLKEDRSTIMLVSDRIAREFPDFSKKSDAEKSAIIRTFWSNLRTLQEKSFKDSEELDTVTSELKPIDVLVIGDRSLDLLVNSQRNVVSSFNCQVKKGFSSETLYTDEFKDFDALMSEYKAREDASARLGHHLVTFVTVHGLKSGMHFPFKNNTTGEIKIDTLMSKIDSKKSSLFITSCFAGAHVEPFIERDISRSPYKNIYTHVSRTVNAIDPEQNVAQKIREAYLLDSGEKFRNADINQDGTVTLGELRYWLDVHTLFHDPLATDRYGNRVVENKPRNPDVKET